MTSIASQRAQAAALGPSAALRAQSASGSRERLVQRPRPVAASQDSGSEWDELARRRRELERLAHGG